MNAAREYAERIADALVDVVEDARWDARIPSIRELASRAGMTHTALNKRMTRTTPFNVRDLAAVAVVLGLHPAELIRRAKAIVDGEDGAVVTEIRPRVSDPSGNLGAVASTEATIEPGDLEDQ